MSNNFESIGKYVLLEKLAMGGMAEVFLARALGAGGISKFFAIKRILPQYADSPEFIDMFREEAKIAINLKHSNIVSIHEFGIQEQQFFLVMDYVEGRNLRQILNKMKKAKFQFSTEHIIYLIREIAAGLDHAHRCIDATTGKPLNITHRDMSPQNVMVSFDGEVKIVDFGIAKAESQVETTRAGTLKGKFGYMSPEQAEGLSVDMRTDIFSLGIVLWEILANDRLFAANNEINTLRKIRDCHIPSLRKINPNIHADLEKIVHKALARDKNLRYQSAAALHKDLNRFLNRQYPDFSSHDFAAFVKTVFADEILQSRKKLVGYAKNSFIDGAISEQNRLSDDKTMVTDSIINSQTSSYIATETNVPAETESSEPDSNDFSSVPSIQTSTKGISQAISNSKVLLDLPPSPAKPEITINQNEKSDPEIVTRPTHKSVTAPTFKAKHSEHADDLIDQKKKKSVRRENSKKMNQSRVNIPVRVKRENSPLGAALTYSIVFMIGFFSMVKLTPEPMSDIIEMTRPVFGSIYEVLGVVGKAHQASLHNQASSEVEHTLSHTANIDANRTLVVTSEPSGAEIFIDNVKTGHITPGRLTLPEQSFTLGLRRKGYEDVSQVIDPRSSDRRTSFILKKLIQGFIDVDVKPLQKIDLYVNNLKIEGESFPIRNYAVPANQPLTIVVVGKNGQKAQSQIQLKENQKQRLSFSLGQPGGRTPSNK